MSMRRLVPSVLCIFVSTASAQNVCDTVLTAQAFDRTSRATTEFVMQAERDALCDKEYSSLQEARQAARKSGFNLGYEGLEIGGSGARQNANSRWEIRDTSFCRATLSDFSSAHQSSYSQQVASVAVRAWENCVQSSQSNQLFLIYEIQDGGNILAGRLVRTAASRIGFDFAITGVGVVGQAGGHVRCRIGTRSIDPNQLETTSYKVTETETVLSCEKIGEGRDKHATLNIQTSQGAIPHVTLPSAQALDEDRIDDVAADVANLASNLRRELVPVGTIVASTLDYETFLSVNGSDRRDWVPADGRRVLGTRYAGTNERVPDLRGVFLRGANSMGSDPSLEPLHATRANPDVKAIGEFQQDVFGTHTHNGKYDSFNPAGIGSRAYATVSSRNKTESGVEWKVKAAGGNETRPRNVTVMYYIKVD